MMSAPASLPLSRCAVVCMCVLSIQEGGARRVCVKCYVFMCVMIVCVFVCDVYLCVCM